MGGIMKLSQIRKEILENVKNFGNKISYNLERYLKLEHDTWLGDLVVTPLNKKGLIALGLIGTGGCASTGLPSIDHVVLNNLNPKTSATASAEPGKEKEKDNKKYAELKKGLNTIEEGVIANTKETRARLITNLTAKGDLLEFFYGGMNEITNFDKYFGRNVIGLGIVDTGVYLSLVEKMNSNGIIDTKVGLRDTNLVKWMGGKGFIDITADKDAANIHLSPPLSSGTTGVIVDQSSILV